MFADPSQTRALRPRLFHDRTGVHIRAVFGVEHLPVQKFRERFESVAKHTMVVIPARITSNAAMAGTIVGLVFGVIVHCGRNDRPDARKQQSRIASLSRRPRHPGHLALVATSEPFLQSGRLRSIGHDATHADGLKSESPPFLLYSFRQRHGCHLAAGPGCGQSKYTVNFAVHCLASHFPQEPVMRVFQSVSFGSNRQEMPPDFSMSTQWVLV